MCGSKASTRVDHGAHDLDSATTRGGRKSNRQQRRRARIRRASLPGHRREIVDEDRRVLPHAFQLGVGDDEVRELEQEAVDAVFGDFFWASTNACLYASRSGAAVTSAR